MVTLKIRKESVTLVEYSLKKPIERAGLMCSISLFLPECLVILELDISALCTDEEQVPLTEPYQADTQIPFTEERVCENPQLHYSYCW